MIDVDNKITVAEASYKNNLVTLARLTNASLERVVVDTSNVVEYKDDSNDIPEVEND